MTNENGIYLISHGIVKVNFRGKLLHELKLLFSYFLPEVSSAVLSCHFIILKKIYEHYY